MKSVEIFFFLIAAIAIFSAIMLVVSSNPVKSIIWLLIVFFTISVNYIILNAQFLAIVNIIVYAGAIMVLFLFVLMLMNLKSSKLDKKKYYIILISILASCCLGITLLMLIPQAKDLIDVQATINVGNIGLIENLGMSLYTDYVFPFLLTNVLFLTAIIGAIVLTKKEKK